ncbi:hypothetical protein K461DRAFT_290397 [Myriangium duriaei CBS 260.36]|uniref:Multiprotein-bridging factor 1 n=1 Tax=Myriangium duriaei CBS 260.36 TaxID=1168546 RepID=A0A9P4JCM1_9PEZI|nr:hypothetical protein K461DRAFT_290397 [Myriangium duriaei CBS 260.36]
MSSPPPDQKATKSQDDHLVHVLFALMDMNVDQAKLAALTGVPKTTVKNWVNKKWRPAATKLLDEAKADGRLDAEGNVVHDNLVASKSRGKGDAVLHGVKNGGVKKGGGKGKIAGAAKAKDEDEDTG